MSGEILPVVEAELVDPRDPAERDSQLSDETIADLQRATAPNTDLAYERWWRRALEWCAHEGRAPLPMTPQTLAEFIGHLKRSVSPKTGKPYSPASLNQAVAAVRTAHFRAGYEGRPNTRAALDLIKVHRQDRAKDGWRTRRAKPITIDVLRLLLAQCDPETLKGRRDATILVLGYGMMGRRSELSACKIEQLTLGEDWLTVFVPLSKTDTDAHGDEVEIPRALAPDIDALAVVGSHLVALAEKDIVQGPLLRRVDRHGNIGDALTPAGINDIVKGLAKKAKLTDAASVTAHGLRAGGPTDAAERGVPVPFIAEHGRWSKNSAQVLTYVRPSDRRRNNPLVRRD